MKTPRKSSKPTVPSPGEREEGVLWVPAPATGLPCLSIRDWLEVQPLAKPSVNPGRKRRGHGDLGDRVLAGGKSQVGMRLNTAEASRGYGVGVLIRAGFLEEAALKQNQARDSVG